MKKKELISLIAVFLGYLAMLLMLSWVLEFSVLYTSIMLFASIPSGFLLKYYLFRKKKNYYYYYVSYGFILGLTTLAVLVARTMILVINR